MPDEDNNFGGLLGLDFRKWWRHMLSLRLWRTWNWRDIYLSDVA